MKVPTLTGPRTQPPSTVQTVYESSANTLNEQGQMLGKALGQLGAVFNQRKKEQEKFDVSKMAIEESMATQQILHQQQQEAPLGAEGFTEQILGNLDERHRTLLSDMRERGFSEDAIADMDLRMTQVRQGVLGRALSFQDQSWKTKIVTDMESVGMNLTQIASMSPYDVTVAIEEFEDTLNEVPGLNAVDKEAIRARGVQSIRFAAGMGLALQDPQSVVDALAPRTHSWRSATLMSESGGRGYEENPNSSAKGYYQILDGTWKKLREKYPEAGLAPDGRGIREQEEIAMNLLEREYRKGLQDAGLSTTNGNMYAAHFLGVPAAKRVLSADDSTPLSSLLPAGVVEANKQLNGKTVGWFRKWAETKGGGPALENRVREDQRMVAGIRRMPIAPDLHQVLNVAANAAGVNVRVTSGGQAGIGEKGPRTGSTRHDHGNAADIELTIDGRVLDPEIPADRAVFERFIAEAVASGATGIGIGPGYMDGKRMHVGFGQDGVKGGPLQFWGKGETARNAPEWLRQIMANARPGSLIPNAGQTGNPVLDGLDAQARMQIYGKAQAALNQQKTSARAGYDNMLTNANTAYLTEGEYTGPLPTREQLHTVYDPFTAENKWQQLTSAQEVGQFIVGMTTQSEADILSAVAALRPTDTASPTYTEQVKAWETAGKAANAVIKQRNDDPANYILTHYPGVAEAWSDNSPEGRTAAFNQMAEVYAQLGFRPDEMVPMPSAVLDAVKAQYAAAGPEGQIQMLTSWRQEMGELYPQALRQLAESGMPVGAYLSGLIVESPQHEVVAANVLRGMALIEHDKSLKPPYNEVNEAFRTALGSEAHLKLGGQMAQAINESATALYIYNGGSPVDFDETIYNSALRQVLGGTAEDDETGVVDLRPRGWIWRAGEGGKTILPPGVNAEQFVSWKDSLIADDLIELSATQEAPVYGTGDAVPVQDIVDEGIFIKVSPGRYVVQMNSDGGYLYTPEGFPYVVEVTPDMFRGTVEIGPLEFE